MTDSTRDPQGQSSDDAFGLSVVRELLRLISETDVTEIKIERDNAKLHIKRGTPPPPQQPFFVTPSLAAAMPHVANMPNVAISMPPAAAEPPEPEFPLGSLIVTAPMVGTFYNAPSPKDAPFVKEGDSVATGDVVGIVEAMKIMNEIESDFAGTVLRVLVTTGQPVEYGQPLLVITPV